jgi:hypothetical protein
MELILAMAMVTMLTISLYASLNAVFKAKRAAERAVKPTRAVSVAMELMSRDIEAALPDRVSPANALATATALVPTSLYGPFYGVSDSMGTGRADSLELHTIGSDGPWEARALSEGVRFVQLSVSTDVNPPVLVRRVTRNLLSSVQEEPEEEILCRNVRSFTLAYFDGTTWYDEWDSSQFEGQIPTAVQVDLEIFVDGAARPGQAPSTYHVTRVIPVSCGVPYIEPTATTTGQ